jgi:hypothetical protein
LALAAGLALAFGWSGGEIRGDARWGALLGHSALGFGATLLVVPHYRFVRQKLQGSRGMGIALLAAVGAAALWAWQIDRTWFSGFTEAGAEARWTVDELGPDAPPARPMSTDLVAVSSTCGEAGCHEAITEEWSGSAHRSAADNALYAAAVGGLVADRGPAAAIACALCHDPDRALSGTVEQAYADGTPEPGDGVSCIGCHAAYDAPEPVGDGRVRFRHPRNHPAAGDDAGRRQLLLDPRLHRQNFQANRHLMSDEGCGVCHRASHELEGGHVLLQNPYRAEEDPGPDRADVVVSCGLCHMPTTTPQPGGRMPLYEHRWPGVNTDLAEYATHADAVALAAGAAAVDVFMEGALSTQHLPDALEHNPEFAAWAEAAAGRGLLDVEVAASWSDVLTIDVQTTHRRAAHPFPIGPFDLQEVWLEVIVQDPGTGETLAHIGALHDHRVDPDAPRLGARLLDAAGEPLREHRLDRLHAVVDRRQIHPGETIHDRLEVPAPSSSDSLLVAAAWRFRRVNPDFAEFAMGEGAIERFAVHTLGAATTAVTPPQKTLNPPSEPLETPSRR